MRVPWPASGERGAGCRDLGIADRRKVHARLRYRRGFERAHPGLPLALTVASQAAWFVHLWDVREVVAASQRAAAPHAAGGHSKAALPTAGTTPDIESDLSPVCSLAEDLGLNCNLNECPER